MCPWVSTTQSMDAGSTGRRSQFRSRNSLSPWNNPQSTRSRAPPASTRNFDPVTVPTPPSNSMAAMLSLGQGAAEAGGPSEVLRPVIVDQPIHELDRIIVVKDAGAGFFPAHSEDLGNN